jgi:hypothetical protein
MIQNHEHLLIGYHEDCGKPIYSNDFKRFESILDNGRSKESIPIYKCLHCSREVKLDDLIPF